MGLTQSTNKQINDKPQIYTDAEIKKNVNNLFLNNKGNSAYAFDEASYSFAELNNMVLSDTPLFAAQLEGGTFYSSLNMDTTGKKFKSSKNRHLQHNITSLIGGEMNDFDNDNSELQKMKNFLIGDNNFDDNKFDDNYGDDENYSEGNYDYMNSEQPPKKPIVSLLSVFHKMAQQKGGAIDSSDESESTDISDTTDSTMDFISDSEEGNFKINTLPRNTKEKDSISTTSSESVYGPTPSETSYDKMLFNNSPKNEILSDVVSSSSPLVISSDGDISTQSSELNIVPFYSSSESDMVHPYVKNRFN